MSVGDRSLVCKDCGQTFIFSAGEQAFYLERGFVDPARCPNCRASRRMSRPQGAQSSGMGGSARGERQLFPAICAECGQETMVPFEPRNGRPVYCRDCYQRMRVQ